jgi:MoaA/NifB/PqqE/SkfB family radical SAM enzyme
MAEKLKVRVELEGNTKNGNFEVERVEFYNEEIKDWEDGKATELPQKITIEQMGSVNIHVAHRISSPGHWCLINRRIVWCPN